MLFKGFKKNGLNLLYGIEPKNGKVIKCMISQRAFKGVMKPLKVLEGSL